MAEGQTPIEVTITSSGSGDTLAVLSLEPQTLVEQVSQQLARYTGDHWRVYRLLHGDKTLQPQDSLSSLGSFESLILVAVALPYLRIPCGFEVLSAAALPSHDLLLVTKGNITSIKDEDIKALGEDSEFYVFWFWRLKKSDRWSFETATLLARTSPLNDSKDLLECAKEPVNRYAWTKEEIEEQKRTGAIKLGKHVIEGAHLFLRVHDESLAVFAWNQSDVFGGGALIDSLELDTGKVSRVCGAYDIWDVASAPDGRFFWISCYDGVAVNTLDTGKVTETATATRRESRILSNTVMIGYHLAYDASLKVLIASSSKHSDSPCVFIISPPEEGSLKELKMIPRAEVVDSLRPPADDRTPGDRSAPWDSVKIPISANKKAQDRKGFYADKGCVTYVHEDEVCTTDLFKGTTECLPCSAPIKYMVRCDDLLVIFTEA